jgi:ketosteroid isomerase-like protein
VTRGRILAIAAVATLGASPAAIAQTYVQADAEKYIADSEAAWVAAEASGDPSVAQRILADDYVGVFPDGSVHGKADAVSSFTAANASLAGRLDYVHVRFFGDTAVAQGQETDTQRAGSPFPSGSLIFTDVFVLRGGQWRLVNSEDQFHPLPK